MADIQKGTITQFSGNMPVVRPFGFGDALTPPLINGWRPCGDAPLCQLCPLPALKVGDMVAFALFEDGTGIVLAKM